MMNKKIHKLQKIINYFCYIKLIKNGFVNKQLIELYNFYEEIIDDGTIGTIFNIEKKPKGKKENNKLLEIWINETTSGGYSGDDFEGDVYIKINNNEYLTFSYRI